MTQAKTLTVQILDKDYCIACPADERANLENADLCDSRQLYGNYQGANMPGCKNCPPGWD